MIGKYKKKGLEVLCVTNEGSSDGKAKTLDFISTTKLIAPVAFLNQGDNSKLMKAAGARGYPSCALINPKGKLVWKGGPNGVTDSLIEEHIAGARIGKGKVGANLAKIEKALQNARTSNSDKSALRTVREEIRGRYDADMAKARTAKAEGRFYDAMMTFELLANHFKGHELGKSAKNDHKAIRSNKELRDEIEVGKRIARAKKEIDAGKKDRAKKSLAIITSGFLKTTKEAERAKAILETL